MVERNFINANFMDAAMFASAWIPSKNPIDATLDSGDLRISPIRSAPSVARISDLVPIKDRKTVMLFQNDRGNERVKAAAMATFPAVF